MFKHAILFTVDTLGCQNLINSREAIVAIIGDIVVFYNSKNLNCIGALSFLKICSHIFMIFEVKLSSDFGHDETGRGAKRRVVLRREIFSL